MSDDGTEALIREGHPIWWWTAGCHGCGWCHRLSDDVKVLVGVEVASGFEVWGWASRAGVYGMPNLNYNQARFVAKEIGVSVWIPQFDNLS